MQLSKRTKIRIAAPFEELNAKQQEQAKAKFFDARPGDGFIYQSFNDVCSERDGNIMCRNRSA